MNTAKKLRQPSSRPPGDWRARPTGPYVRFEKQDVEQSIGQRFEAQVHRHPDCLAVKTRRGAATYRALNEAANRIGHAIVAAGGGEHSAVALLVEEDILLIAAMLGAAKAGKTYVVVDPSYPARRMAFMLDDSQVGLILCDSRNLDLAKRLAGHECRVLSVERPGQGLPVDDLEFQVSPDTPAYLLYTSGSTGTPKGVVQNHRVVLHNVMKYTNSFHICADDRLTMLFSYSFGEAMNNVYCALLNGASIFPWAVARHTVSDLAAWLGSERITIYHSVATVFRHFVAGLRGDERFDALRVVNLSGEPVYRQDMDLYAKYFSPPCVLVNSLGSTETKLICQYFANHGTRVAGNVVPVGYAAEDVTVQVLDEEGREAGPGRVGEIVVTSKYLSQGYWRRQEHTERAFLPCPDGLGATTYRTGDLGRMAHDGLIEHLGRKDSQVKVRGFRIELGEVEAVLMQHPAVRGAAVLAREDEPGDRRLVAYVVPAQDRVPTVAELREYLSEGLPEYMVPLAFVLLDALPLTSNGKVDRRSLLALEPATPALPAAYAAPRDMLERELAQLWRSVLGVPRVGVEDDFFALGGHSLQAARLSAELERLLGQRLPPAALHQAPTVAKLAALLRQEGCSEALTHMVALHTGGERRPFFCVASLDALAYAHLSQCLGPQQPFYVLRPTSRCGPWRPEISVQGLAARYAEEVKAAQPAGPYLLGGMCAGATVAFEMAQQLQAEQKEVALLALIDPLCTARRWLDPWDRLAALIVHHLRMLWRQGRGERVAYLRARLRALKRRLRPHAALADESVDEEAALERYWRPVHEAYRRILGRYVPQPYAGHLALFLGEETPAGLLVDPRLAWRKLAPGRTKVLKVPGNHTDMLRPPHVRALAERLSRCLTDVHGTARD